MKERPILFSGEMVQAILDGRKTQTRRAVKRRRNGTVPWISTNPASDTDPNCITYGLPPVGPWPMENTEDGMCPMDCPHGQPGDQLWVKETFYTWDGVGSFSKFKTGRVWYRADGLKTFKWKPSIFMPRWASRLTLEITNVRVERLQDISEDDAWAEGCKRGEPTDNGGWFPAEEPDPSGIGDVGWDCSVDWYADLWDSINGKGAWDKNPYVWVIEFRKIACAVTAAVVS